MSDDFWIVSSHDFAKHSSPASALAEANRLAKLTSHKFHVYRVVAKLGAASIEAAVATGAGHLYVRGRHTRGACTVCGKPKADAIHVRP
jgi:hypothetical protein